MENTIRNRFLELPPLAPGLCPTFFISAVTTEYNSTGVRVFCLALQTVLSLSDRCIMFLVSTTTFFIMSVEKCTRSNSSSEPFTIVEVTVCRTSFCLHLS